MARFGVFCLPWTGHLNPMATLALELQRRGHQITFFHVADFGEAVRRRGLAFEAFGERNYPPGTFTERARQLSRLDGLAASEASFEILTSQADALFTAAPPVIERARLDAWLVDHLDYAASTLAACMRAAFVTVVVGLLRHPEEGVPGFSGEPYTDDPAVLERDHRFNEAMLEMSRPFREYVGRFRENAGLGPFSFETLWSGLAQITQQPAELEFPRTRLPACFHFTGPFVRRADRPSTPFPWNRLTGAPLVYASFGTMQSRNLRLHEAVARAADGLDAQVVLSLGDAEAVELPQELPPNLLVVPFAPQLEVLEKAAVMITHGGMNSTLEAVSAGVPLVAVPIANDQHGIAARIEWTGTGVRVPAAECEPQRLRTALETVLGQASFRDSAERFQRIIAGTDGLGRAAGIIEQVVATGRPVLREASPTVSRAQRAAAPESRRRVP